MRLKFKCIVGLHDWQWSPTISKNMPAGEQIWQHMKCYNCDTPFPKSRFYITPSKSVDH